MKILTLTGHQISGTLTEFGNHILRNKGLSFFFIFGLFFFVFFYSNQPKNIPDNLSAKLHLYGTIDLIKLKTRVANLAILELDLGLHPALFHVNQHPALSFINIYYFIKKLKKNDSRCWFIGAKGAEKS